MLGSSYTNGTALHLKTNSSLKLVILDYYSKGWMDKKRANCTQFSIGKPFEIVFKIESSFFNVKFNSIKDNVKF